MNTLVLVSRGSLQSRGVTVAALGWARVFGARIRYDAEANLIVCEAMRGGFARGGTCVGGAFLTGRAVSSTGPDAALLRHEAVHAEQWARYGVSFAVRYLFEESRHRGAANRFEIEAGLADGGYLG